MVRLVLTSGMTKELKRLNDFSDNTGLSDHFLPIFIVQNLVR